ncbi:MAG: DUF7019 family protein [Acidimicrobiales bacterium]
MPRFLRRTRKPPVRYYVYLSRTKVEMLFPQISKSFSHELEVELTARTGLLDATVRRTPDEPVAQLAAQAAAVEAYLVERDEVGSISEPARYIRGDAPLRYGIVTEYAADLAVFAGSAGAVKLGLIGSPESLVGSVASKKANHSTYYYTLEFLNGLASDRFEARERPPYCNSYAEAIDIALAALPPPDYRLEFLAKVLHSQADTLLATPIYVALTE